MAEENQKALAVPASKPRRGRGKSPGWSDLEVDTAFAELMRLAKARGGKVQDSMYNEVASVLQEKFSTVRTVSAIKKRLQQVKKERKPTRQKSSTSLVVAAPMLPMSPPRSPIIPQSSTYKLLLVGASEAMLAENVLRKAGVRFFVEGNDA